MIIGIDVGGTHADGVLLERSEIIAKEKVAADRNSLEESIIVLLERMLAHCSQEDIERVHLSTTVCTNALVTGATEEVGMFIQAGPGMNPDFLQCGSHCHFLSGAIDHRGKVIRHPSVDEIDQAAREYVKKGISSVGVVTKFSHRNNSHELTIGEQLAGSFTNVCLGHTLSGLPNFPRRVYTTWLNASLTRTFLKFKQDMERAFSRLSLSCPCYILKADGGTIPFNRAALTPCQSLHSGPSASVMGALALSPISEDGILLDIGGTTTDIAILKDGIPLLEPYGAVVDSRPTLIRALLTTSIGLGGDSMVTMKDGAFVIGPLRKGPPMAFGGEVPTPTDAMVALGHIAEGDKQRAYEAMRLLLPTGKVETTAKALLEACANKVCQATWQLIDLCFQRPVYTVSDFLDRQSLQPTSCIAIGGPAAAMQPFLRERFGINCIVPENFEVANAIGAARARLTVEASLYGDTGAKRLSIPEISLLEEITSRFTMVEAEARLSDVVNDQARSMGMLNPPTIDFIERLEMNTIKGFSTTGKIIHLRAQIRPGLA